MLHNHPSGVLEPSPADLQVAANLFESGLGTVLVDNEATRIFVVVEPPEPRTVTPLDVEHLVGLLAPRGELSRRHAAFEDRPGQQEMLRRVADRYNGRGVAVIEAGTGTGKSLAYLLPAAKWAIQNEERTVVSTATINLQQQLVEKDLPLVKQVLGEDFEWALLKGRANYVSIRRARLAVATAAQLFEDDRSTEMKSLLDWLGATQDGSLSDLSFVPSDEAWEAVRSDSDICLRARCPHFQECFYQRARRKAASAQVLVANHHLLFTDLAVRRASGNYSQGAVLPPYRHLVIDEAHNAEDAATSHMGVDVSRRGMYRLLARLERGGRGILAALEQELQLRGGDPHAVELRSRIERRLRPAVTTARAALDVFMDAMKPVLPSDVVGAIRIGTEQLPEPADRVQVREGLDGLLGSFRTLERELALLRDRIEGIEALLEVLEGRLLDVRGVERRLLATIAGLRTVLLPGPDSDNLVRWLEWSGRGSAARRNLVLAAAPIVLGDILRDELFARTETVVLTSATLATRGSFDFLRARLGIDPLSLEATDSPPFVTQAVVPTPFDFETQSLLLVPTDLPDVNAPGDAFQASTVTVVEDLARKTGGGLFVLFTSHRALRSVADGLEKAGSPWPLFVQGEEDRARLLARFIEAGDGILLGTSSFWEGVDVPGHPLRGLVIQRIPFKVPTEPINAARVDAIEQVGGNSFWEFTLPVAALRLKQGFGRLIRSTTDRGVVVILDDRIVRKRYGVYLRDSLPSVPMKKGAWSDISRVLEDFYGR